MPEAFENEAWELVAELERAAGDRVTLSFDMKRKLVDDFVGRLQNSKEPEVLLYSWKANTRQYAVRALTDAQSILKRQGLEADQPFEVTETFINRQFSLCSEVCPPPHDRELITSGGRRSSGGSAGGSADG